MVGRTELTFVVILLTLTTAKGVNVRGLECSTSDIDRDMKSLYTSMKSLARSSSAKKAAMVRGGFHDCATTVKAKPKSGCNGSLRNELVTPSNARLVAIMGDIESALLSSAKCVSFADGILIAYAAAVKEAKGGSFVTDLVNPATPREDVADGVVDADDATGELPMPNPFSKNFNDHLKFYSDRKFSARDMIISNVVGHSLGGFSGSPDSTGAATILPFTTDRAEIGPLYAGHLTWRQSTGKPDLSGFNTLPSDEAMMSHSTGLSIMQGYCSFADNGPDSVSFSWADGGMMEALMDFKAFSIKMSQLSGALMNGDASFDLSAVGNPLRMETAGWDSTSQNVPYTQGDFLEEEENETEVDVKVDRNAEKKKNKGWRNKGKNAFKKRFRPRGRGNPWLGGIKPGRGPPKNPGSRGRGKGRGNGKGNGNGKGKGKGKSKGNRK